jgi:hypothetical protein
MEITKELLNKILLSSVVYPYISLFIIYFFIIALIPEPVKNKLSLPSKSICIPISIALIFNYIFLLILYSIHGNFFDHAEANIAVVSWLFEEGNPIYHDLGAAERYTIPYGPMLYVINDFFLKLIKPSIFSAKIGGILAALLSLSLIFVTLKKYIGSQIATFCLAYLSLNWISINAYFVAAFFWNRSDSFLLMFVALGLLAVLRTNSLLAIIVSSLALGISVNLKIHAILYFLPIYVLLYYRYGIYSALVSLLSSLALAIVPFVTLPQVSLNNYLLWLNEFSVQGISLNILRGNIIWSLYILAPLILLLFYFKYINQTDFYAFIHQQKPFVYSLIISLSTVIIIGSKQGAGMNHLIPFYPAFSYFFVLTLHSTITAKREKTLRTSNKYYYCASISLVLALVTITALRGALNESRLITLSTKYNSEPINEIHKIIKSNPGITIGMGYGKPYDLTFYRPLLVFSGNPYLIDAVSLMDAEFLGKDVPELTLKSLSSCETKLWLIPTGSLPFQLNNYFNNRPVFSKKFQSKFLEHYQLRAQTKYYDLWLCDKKVKPREQAFLPSS